MGEDFMAGMILGTVMFSIGVYFFKTGKQSGTPATIIVGLVMCLIPLFVGDPYIISETFIALWFINKWLTE